MSCSGHRPTGAFYLGGGKCEFVAWAPLRQRVELQVMSPYQATVPMQQGQDGYWQCVANAAPGTRYLFRLDGELTRPDPASRHQPEGVHGPSEVVDSHYPWDEGAWKGLALSDYIIYELHVGTATGEGTFEALLDRLGYFKELGVTAIELMPVAQFPGGRNWGYDGTYPYAPQCTYGTPHTLKRLVEACHKQGLSVILDVVYNHLGPEGNYSSAFGPYFTSRYKTPWGDAVNFDGPYSDGVRGFFINNALYWLEEFHIDALRLDAVHGIFDFSARHFLAELAQEVERCAARTGRLMYVIAESDLNDARLITPRAAGGYGMAAQWSDDFHHSVHAALTGESQGYYEDFGQEAELARAFAEGFVYAGQYSIHRKRRHGSPSVNLSAQGFVVFSQNHDQVGNRMMGDRLCHILDLARLKLAAASVLLSPYVPLLFMGEEYGETAAFMYFVSHHDKDLIESVRRGRRQEFAAFNWQGQVPDPQDEETFLDSKLRHELYRKDWHSQLFAFYRELIRLRKTLPPLRLLSREHKEVSAFHEGKLLAIRRWCAEEHALVVLNFSAHRQGFRVGLPEAHWEKVLDSGDPRWGGNEERKGEMSYKCGVATVDVGPMGALVFSSGGGQ